MRGAPLQVSGRSRALQQPHAPLNQRPVITRTARRGEVSTAAPPATIEAHDFPTQSPTTSPTTNQPWLIVQELRESRATDLIIRRSSSTDSNQDKHTSFIAAAEARNEHHNASSTDYNSTQAQDIIRTFQSFFLPEGYPGTVTPDFLPYQLWALPTHVLGSLAHSLTTSSLLQAVGVSAGPVATTAAGAAMRWITKDGLGALGRFLVGGGLAAEFDRDPRKWRMVAELCTACGAAFEIGTALSPQNFVLLATSGRFAKALGKSIGKPVFRVIQTHFARDSNVGAIAAKEEVWEVVAQLTGYGVSIGVLSALDQVMTASGEKGEGAGYEIVAVWAAVQATHACLRYKTLSMLVFSGLNEPRLRMLATSFILGQSLGSPQDVNGAEPFLPFWPHPMLAQPKIHFGTRGLKRVLLTSPGLWGEALDLIAEQLPSSWSSFTSLSDSSPPSVNRDSSEDSSNGVSSTGSLGERIISHGVGQDSDNGRPETTSITKGIELSRSLDTSSSLGAAPLLEHGTDFSRSNSNRSAGSDSNTTESTTFTTGSPSSIVQLPTGGMQELGLERLISMVLECHAGEEHVLVWKGGEAFVFLHEGAGQQAAVRAVWQAVWLHHNHRSAHSWAHASPLPAAQEEQPSSASERHRGTVEDSQGTNFSADQKGSETGGAVSPAEMVALAASVRALREQFPKFEVEAREKGWDTSRVLVSTGPYRLRVVS